MRSRPFLFIVFALGFTALTGASDVSWGGGKTPESVADAGKIYGLALAASTFCPGGVLTEKGKAFARDYGAEEANIFERESQKIVEVWTEGTRCDTEKMDLRRQTMCRIMRKRNCQALWAQVGPGGSVVPGLIDFDLSTLD